jgi:hypothetical protein
MMSFTLSLVYVLRGDLAGAVELPSLSALEAAGGRACSASPAMQLRRSLHQRVTGALLHQVGEFGCHHIGFLPDTHFG